MFRFYLLIFTFVLALNGHCQEMTSEVDLSVSSSSDIIISEDLEYHTEDMQSFIFPDVPTEEILDEESVDQTSEAEEPTIVTQFNYKDSKYWGRYTALRTAGWISFGAGIGFFIGGYAMILGAWASTNDSAEGLGVAGSLMLVSAPILVVASIPLLACAYYNRHKAKKMSLNLEASMLRPNSVSPLRTSAPSLGLAFRF